MPPVLLLAAGLAVALAAANPAPPPIEPLPALDGRAPFLDAFEAARAPDAAWPDAPYRPYRALMGALTPAARARPGRIRPFVVGRTGGGRPIWGFILRDPARPVTTRMLVFANLHAMEWIGAEAAAAFAEDYAEHPTPGVEVVVIPVLNVDGRLRVEADRLAGRTVLRRGNRDRVDLNRDFAVHHEATSAWRHLLPAFHGSSEAPLSQPETRAIDRLAARGGFDLAISLHAFGGLVAAPWSGAWARPPDWPRLHALGTALSAGQGAHAYRVLQLSRWAFFFRAQGSEIDHLYGRYGTPAYLVECTRSGIEPLRPSTWTDPFRRYNPRNPERHVREVVRLLRAGAVALAGMGPARVEPPSPPPEPAASPLDAPRRGGAPPGARRERLDGAGE